MAVMAAVATRPLATRAARPPPAVSICDSTQPPKMSPLPFMSEGCGTVLTIGSRRLSDIQDYPFLIPPPSYGGGYRRGKAAKATSQGRDHDLKLAHTDRVACPPPYPPPYDGGGKRRK